MEPHITDTRPLMTSAVATASSVIDRLTPAHLDLPTPCGDFTVRQLAGHMGGVVRRVSTIYTGAHPMSVDADAEFAVDAAGSIAAGWHELVAAEQAAWTNGAALGLTIELPWVVQSGAACVMMWAGELTTHTWDIAKATGIEVVWDDAVVLAGYGCIRAMLPDAERAPIFEAMRATMPPEMQNFPAPYADAVAVPSDAPWIDQLVAWSGRQP